MNGIPPPNVRELLLPLLACLSTALLSPRPPPALLPLLSPILRQRVHLRTSVAPPSSNPSTSQTWLNLLTWSPSRVERLTETVSNLQLELHPVSGELELFDDEEDAEAGRPRYRRLDSETLQARCEVREHGLAVVWVWCQNDTGGIGLPSDAMSGEAQNGWRVAEVQPVDRDQEEQAGRADDQNGWYESIVEAEEAAVKSSISRPLSRTTSRPTIVSSESNSVALPTISNSLSSTTAPAEEVDDDDYWASYDRTPEVRSPAAKRSPAPPTPQPRTTNQIRPTAVSAEDEYYARYGSVQPALDAHDPDEEEGTEDLESTLHQRQDLRQEYNTQNKQYQQQQQQQQSIPSPPHSESEQPMATSSAPTAPLRIHSPTPSRPSSSGSHSGGRRSPVATLESSAESATTAELGVKQHISTEMKSLYRLARAAGIERSEFERVIRTELDVLGMMDE